MIIDENKEYVAYRLEQKDQDLTKTCSDHNIVLLKIDFHAETIQTKEYKIITNKGYKKYRENIEQIKITKVITTGQIQNIYDKWCKIVERSVKKVTRKRIGKTPAEI